MMNLLSETGKNVNQVKEYQLYIDLVYINNVNLILQKEGKSKIPIFFKTCVDSPVFYKANLIFKDFSRSILSLFFATSLINNNTRARMLDSIYHMTLRFL